MTNTIENELNERLKGAMRAKDQRVLDVIRAIRAKILEAKTAKGFSGEVDDALYLGTIAAYVKSMSKAIEEFAAAGERGQENADKLRFEVDYLSTFLPKKLGAEETRTLVRDVIAQIDAKSRKEMGRVMGTVMKTHKDQVDAALVRTIVENLLPE